MTSDEINGPEFFLPSDFLDDFTESSDEESSNSNPKASIVMGSSPQSTLSGIGSWSFSSNESPDAPSTPLLTPSVDPLDILNAAVGQVERLALENRNNQKIGYLRNQELIKQQLQAARFYQMKRQQLMKMQYANAVWERERRANAVRSQGLSFSEWPPLQKQQAKDQKQAVTGSGMTAVFLNGGRRQSNGTGVFLPRQTAPEHKKKHGCSAVLLPARVVQALNLNVEEMGVHPRMAGCYIVENEGLPGSNNNCSRRNYHQHAAAPVSTSPEVLRLPQEWTY